MYDTCLLLLFFEIIASAHENFPKKIPNRGDMGGGLRGGGKMSPKKRFGLGGSSPNSGKNRVMNATRQ